MILSIISKVALGALIGGVVGGLVTGDPIYSIVWSVALPIFIVFTMLNGFRRMRGGFTGAADGGFALARVETAQRTGAEREGAQEVDVRLTVAAKEPYATTARMFIAPDNLRNFASGTIVVVTRFGSERPDVIVVAEPSPEWVAKAAAARADPSLIPAASAVPAWESATTTTSGTAKPRTRRVTSPASRVIAIAIIVVSAALTLIPAYPSIARNATNVARGDWDGNSMLTGSYQQFAVDEIAAVAGHYEFTSIYFYDSYVIATGLSRPGVGTTDEYMWRYGRAFRQGPQLIQPSTLDDELFDASELDFSIVATLVEKSVTETKIEGRDFVLAYVSRVNGGQPLIHIAISGSYDDVYYDYDFNGNLVGDE